MNGKIAVSVVALVFASWWICAGAAEAFRPPAVPLVACDPYFSIWSCADRLSDDATRHWTGAKHSLASMIRVEGRTFRLMGDTPADVPAMAQVSLTVLATRTIYEFEGSGVHVTLTFMTASLADDLELLSRPLTYLTWDVRSCDGQERSAAVYFSNSGELAVHAGEQQVVWSREQIGELVSLRMGTEEQPILQRKGDGVRIDWGYIYAAAPREGTAAVIGSDGACAAAFVERGGLAGGDDVRMPRAVNDELPVAAFVFELGRVGTAPVSRYLMLAYDDEYSIYYFGQRLRPYWRRGGAEAEDLLHSGAKDYRRVKTACEAFDGELTADLAKVGGEEYARLCALAYRQCLAGNKVAADANGQPLLFPKENTSNGCIATVDVIYPMSPLFLLFSPTLAKASLVTQLSYASSQRWKFPFAPHDLGTYPRATGQVYGGGERTQENQMPVEESGNMILLLAAVAKIEGNADFAAGWWPVVTKWAEFLEAKGFDPENQLCTDDFAGHLTHNANLSVKAIEALGAYGMLCDMRGLRDEAARYRRLAGEMVGKWIEAADDGDHYRLAFDAAGTWSQKYNLVWDRILDLRLFPAEVVRKELAYYRKVMNRYGVPLDNRKDWAKLDWALWAASLAEDQAGFEALSKPVYDFLHQVPQRNAMTDLYWTQSGEEVGMHARPVVGGVFIKMLMDPDIWRKWAGRDKGRAGNWAILPVPPVIREVEPTAQKRAVVWRYTFERPGGDWYKAEFKDDTWKEGPAGFGTPGTPGAVVGTRWDGKEIWLRREFTAGAAWAEPQLYVHHDEDVEIYINGVLAAKASGYTVDYELMEMTTAAQKAIRAGKNVLAVHCRQTGGGQYIDVGIVELHRGTARL